MPRRPNKQRRQGVINPQDPQEIMIDNMITMSAKKNNQVWNDQAITPTSIPKQLITQPF